jgi:hypothetical protein
MFKTPKAPSPPPPPPPPKAIPVATDPNVRQAAIEAERKGRKRSGRQSTLMQGSLGDGIYTAPETQTATMLG